MEQAAELFSRAQDLAAARTTPPLISRSKIEEFQRTPESILETSVLSCFVCADRAFYFAPHVSELLH
jgi:hypothetical protein